MEKKDDGGLAFACEYMVKAFAESRHHADEDKERLLSNVAGMTLRDYFAAKAMQARVTIGAGPNIGAVARDAYRLADAMLQARKS